MSGEQGHEQQGDQAGSESGPEKEPPPYEPDLSLITEIEKGLDPDDVEYR